MSLTGGLAPNGRFALLTQKIWQEETNAEGGMLGRPVKLIFYHDDKSSPSEIPPIYTKLPDVDKFDLVGAYGTALTAPAMPIIIQGKKTFIRFLALAVLSQNPKQQTVAIVAAEQEFSRNAADGARENIRQGGLKVVYERTYWPATADSTLIARAIAATNPDLVVLCLYPPGSVGMVRAVNELGFKPKAIGVAMVGLQSTAIRAQLGSLLNGFINYEFWLPVPKMQFPGVAELISCYQATAAAEGVDPLGYYMAPWGYAQVQVVQQAAEAIKTLDDAKLADYLREQVSRRSSETSSSARKANGRSRGFFRSNIRI